MDRVLCVLIICSCAYDGLGLSSKAISKTDLVLKKILLCSDNVYDGKLFIDTLPL